MYLQKKENINKMTDFPYREYSEDELMDEYEKLIEYQPSKTLQRRNIGYKCSNAFFQYERMNTASNNHLTNVDYWDSNKTKILKYHKQLNRKQDLFTTIHFLNHPPAQFPPNIAIDLYTKFHATRILDPFAGWGDRCIAAMSTGLNYTGIDSNRNLKLPYREMIRFYPHLSTIKFINKPVEKVDISKLDFDFVLTSPPFWDEREKRIEHYNDMKYSEYEEFMDIVFIPTILKCIKKAKWSCYHMPNHMAKYVTKNTGLKWDKKLKFSYSGNKKQQNCIVYCLKKL